MVAFHTTVSANTRSQNETVVLRSGAATEMAITVYKYVSVTQSIKALGMELEQQSNLR